MTNRRVATRFEGLLVALILALVFSASLFAQKEKLPPVPD